MMGRLFRASSRNHVYYFDGWTQVCVRAMFWLDSGNPLVTSSMVWVIGPIKAQSQPASLYILYLIQLNKSIVFGWRQWLMHCTPNNGSIFELDQCGCIFQVLRTFTCPAATMNWHFPRIFDSGSYILLTFCNKVFVWTLNFEIYHRRRRANTVLCMYWIPGKQSPPICGVLGWKPLWRSLGTSIFLKTWDDYLVQLQTRRFFLLFVIAIDSFMPHSPAQRLAVATLNRCNYICLNVSSECTQHVFHKPKDHGLQMWLCRRTCWSFGRSKSLCMKQCAQEPSETILQKIRKIARCVNIIQKTREGFVHHGHGNQNHERSHTSLQTMKVNDEPSDRGTVRALQVLDLVNKSIREEAAVLGTVTARNSDNIFLQLWQLTPAHVLNAFKRRDFRQCVDTTVFCIPPHPDASSVGPSESGHRHGHDKWGDVHFSIAKAGVSNMFSSQPKGIFWDDWLRWRGYVGDGLKPPSSNLRRRGSVFRFHLNVGWSCTVLNL